MFESVGLLAYAAGWFALINLVIVLYEEPALRSRFGESYQRYCRAVGRWLPGRPFNDAGNLQLMLRVAFLCSIKLFYASVRVPDQK